MMMIICNDEKIKLGDLVLYKYPKIDDPPSRFYLKIGSHYYLESFFERNVLWVGFVLDIKKFSYENEATCEVFYMNKKGRLEKSFAPLGSFVKAKVV